MPLLPFLSLLADQTRTGPGPLLLVPILVIAAAPLLIVSHRKARQRLEEAARMEAARQDAVRAGSSSDTSA